MFDFDLEVAVVSLLEHIDDLQEVKAASEDVEVCSPKLIVASCLEVVRHKEMLAAAVESRIAGLEDVVYKVSGFQPGRDVAMALQRHAHFECTTPGQAESVRLGFGVLVARVERSRTKVRDALVPIDSRNSVSLLSILGAALGRYSAAFVVADLHADEQERSEYFDNFGSLPLWEISFDFVVGLT